MNDITAIKNYILFLKKECALSITLHQHRSGLILKRDLIAFNIHENPYCVYVKSCASAQQHCIKKQEKIIEKCKDGSFCGVCYAGVKEYVYPNTHQGKVVGFICVSGYATQNNEEYIRAVSEKFPLSKERLASVYQSLKKEMPPKEYVDTLIYPLCHMLELAHIKAETLAVNDDTFMEKLVRYIKKNYTQNLTSDVLCKEFYCSRSHLSHTFNKQMHMSLKEYLNTLRIDSAKMLLQNSQLDIAEISLSLGFSDPNYFTVIFKKYTGVTPSAYRAKHK